MDVTLLIQMTVARMDLIVCQVLALPWKRIAMSVLLAALVIHVVKAVRNQ